jgi:general stress protein YciG
MTEEKKIGFAALSAAERRRLASKGGKAAHANGQAHEFTSAEARAAGSKGGVAVSKDRAYMSELGRRGGHARAEKLKHEGPRARDDTAPDSTEAPDSGQERRAEREPEGEQNPPADTRF